jgi:hypothetical protein
VHSQIVVASVQLLDTVTEVDHRQSGERFEPARMLRVSFGKGIVEDPAQVESLGTVALFLDPTAGVGKDANIDAVPIHYVEVFSMIKRVEAHSPDILLSFRHKVEKFSRKGMKMSIDDHGFSSSNISPLIPRGSSMSISV